MKKFLLSFSVLGVFFAYAIHLKTDSDERQVIALGTPAAATFAPNPTTAPVSAPRGQYKDGSYTSPVADAFYGPLQIKVVVSGGRISDVQFLQHPSDRQTSVEINSQAMPMLRSEVITAQSAKVDGVTGATQTSRAFIESLNFVLSQAI